MRLRSFILDELTIDDERSFRHVALYDELKRAVRRDGLRFWVSNQGMSWDRALFLNLTFYSPDAPGNVLMDDHIPADVVMHAAWHHLTHRAFATERTTPSAHELLLAESIASAFDLYLVGRLLGHAPESDFLQSQVPAMAEIVEGAGMTEQEFETVLQGVANDPDRAFEALRELLFDSTTALLGCHHVDDASTILERFASHPYAALLHHYELSNWILYCRAHASLEPDSRVLAVDATLRSTPVALDWLEQHWIQCAVEPVSGASG